jgi:hypothetical protein
METKTVLRILVVMAFAITFTFLAGVISADATSFFPQPTTANCLNCHPVIGDSWEHSAHQESGLECETCHNPVNEKHPQETMPTDISSRQCATCHADTMAEFETSIHGSEDLTCVRCHNAHTASTKSENVQSLCQACHQDLEHYYAYTTHAENNVLCTDCHLPMAAIEGDADSSHRVHTFAPELASCETCHGEDLHPVEDQPCTEEEISRAEALGLDYPCKPEEIVQAGLGIPCDGVISDQPGSVRPVGFAITGVLVGVAAGMLASPWLEKWYERFRK